MASYDQLPPILMRRKVPVASSPGCAPAGYGPAMRPRSLTKVMGLIETLEQGTPQRSVRRSSVGRHHRHWPGLVAGYARPGESREVQKMWLDLQGI